MRRGINAWRRGPFVSGPAFEIIEEFFVVSLVQRFKSLRGTYGRLGIQ